MRLSNVAALFLVFASSAILAADPQAFFSTPFVFAGLEGARRMDVGSTSQARWNHDQFIGVSVPGGSEEQSCTIPGAFCARMEGSVFAFLSRAQSDRATPPESFAFAPGARLFVGASPFRESAVRFLVGRIGADNLNSAALLFPHGPLTGIHVISGNEQGAMVRASVHNPALAGTFQRPDADGTFDKTINVSRINRGASGYELSLFARRGWVRGTLRYGQIGKESEGSLRPARDEINLVGGGVALGPDETLPPWLAVLVVEKAAGSWEAGYRDEKGGSRRKVDGAALTAQGVARAGRMSLSLAGFLPEPGSRASGSRPSSRESSGFAAFGDSLLTQTALDRTMGFGPFPVLCEGCRGLTSTRSETAFVSHASVLKSVLSYAGPSTAASAQYIVMRPITAGSAGSKNPGPDTTLPTFHEYSVQLSWIGERTSGLSVRYARIVKRFTNKPHAQLTGEALGIQLNYSF